jgi:hypothetical protein
MMKLLNKAAGIPRVSTWMMPLSTTYKRKSTWKGIKKIWIPDGQKRGGKAIIPQSSNNNIKFDFLL